jgi:hypothetical protein
MSSTCRFCKHWKRQKDTAIYKHSWIDENEELYETKDVRDYPFLEEDKVSFLSTNKSNFGDCSCTKFEYDFPNEYKPELYDKSKLYYCDGEEYSAFFVTGEDFGCIYFEQK